MDTLVEHGRRPVRVVVTCTNRKRRAVPNNLRIANVPVRTAAGRCDEWITRLSNGSAGIPARELYAGEHWQVAASLTNAVGPHADLWVSSAGYGLIPATAPIHPYAATFTANQPDSVATTSEAARQWWRGLSQWEGPVPQQPRSFTALAERDPTAVIVAVLSDAYLRACSQDLRDAASRLNDADTLAVFGPAGGCPELDGLVVPVTAALRPLVGGSLQALNVRVADHILRVARDSGTPLRHSSLRTLVADAIAAAPRDTTRRPAGVRMTDEQVRAFVRDRVGDKPTSATKLLRLLRDSGMSCEQSRFKTLFASATSEGTA